MFIVDHRELRLSFNEFHYLKIVPEYSFGLGRKELLPDKDLQRFLGYKK